MFVAIAFGIAISIWLSVPAYYFFKMLIYYRSRKKRERYMLELEFTLADKACLYVTSSRCLNGVDSPREDKMNGWKMLEQRCERYAWVFFACSTVVISVIVYLIAGLCKHLDTANNTTVTESVKTPPSTRVVWLDEERSEYVYHNNMDCASYRYTNTRSYRLSELNTNLFTKCDECCNE